MSADMLSLGTLTGTVAASAERSALWLTTEGIPGVLIAVASVVLAKERQRALRTKGEPDGRKGSHTKDQANQASQPR